MTARLYLALDDAYPGPLHVWSKRGPLMADQLAISEALLQELLDWQSEALDPAHPRAQRSEDEWERDGYRLAERLAAETGQPVEFVH